MNSHRVLTVNSGSSSIKFSVYTDEELLLSGKMDGQRFRASDPSAKVLIDEPLTLTDRDAAAKRLIDWLRGTGNLENLTGVGYRVVHGGPKSTEPALRTPTVMAELRRISPLAPDHLPDQITAIERISAHLPGTPSVACFDTAFHRTMPRYAQVFGLPNQFISDGLVRYGFHGLSYSYIVEELTREHQLPERLIVAHLGNGASMCALLNGKSVDTSMGLTPSGGFPMSNRSGDLDPGIILWLMREKHLTVDQVAEMVNQQGGLQGLSGTTGDMQILEKDSPKTVFVFCYNIKKFLGAYIAALGGLDALVFTGGIGENSAFVRAGICTNLERLGIVLDEARNQQNSAVISSDASPITVRVLKTNEELVIARLTQRLIKEPAQ